jgi:hypothetical protein
MLSFSAQADIIKCYFTEPFITTQYSMVQQRLTYFGPDLNGSDSVLAVYNKVSFQIKGAGDFEIVSKDGKVLQKLTLNFKGSDGMSDQTYPYDVQDYTMRGANNGVGGCASNYLKPVGGGA